MLRYGDGLCIGCVSVVLAGCSVPDLQIVEVSDDGKTAGSPFVPRELPDASSGDSGTPEDNADAGLSASTITSTAGRPARNNTGGAGGRAAGGTTATAGTAGLAGTAGSPGLPGAAVSGSGGSAGSSPADAGVDADPPAGPATDEPNPCLVWKKVSSFDRAPADAVEGGLETTAGIQARQYVCRVKPPGLDYAVVGKAIFGNGCLAAYRVDGSMKTHNQQNGSPFEVLTAAPGCTFTWQRADNTSLPSGVLDMSDPPGRKLYACHGEFDGPLSSGVQVGGVHGASDMPPRYECWFESYTSPMQPLNPMTFEVLVQAP